MVSKRTIRKSYLQFRRLRDWWKAEGERLTNITESISLYELQITLYLLLIGAAVLKNYIAFIK